MKDVYYYDAEARELRDFVEGSPLNSVVGLRDLAGNLIAFDEDGYVRGVFGDAGSFTPVPADFPKRHISEYGTRFKVQDSKPEMLKPLRAPDEIASIPVYLETTGHVQCGSGTARLLKFISGRLVLRFDLWSNRNFDTDEKLRYKYKDFEFTHDLVDTLRKCASSETAFVIFSSAPPMGIAGEVILSRLSIADALIVFSKHLPS